MGNFKHVIAGWEMIGKSLIYTKIHQLKQIGSLERKKNCVSFSIIPSYKSPKVEIMILIKRRFLK